MKIANYNKTNGKLLGWYDSEIHETIPTPNIKVSNEDWQVAIDNNYNFVDVATNTLSFKDFRTFVELQIAKIISLKTDYENANELDIAYMKTTFQADKASQDLIVKVLSAGSVPTGFFWIDKANNQVTMTFTQLQGLSGAILTRNQTNFIKFQGLKAKVALAKTQVDLDLIVW